MRIRLEYYDQNEGFARLLPQDGTVERNISSEDGKVWALFHLDAPIVYDGHPYEYCLLRSRWVGSEIGDADPPSVFIFLVSDIRKAVDGFKMNDFMHVAWGMAVQP